MIITLILILQMFLGILNDWHFNTEMSPNINELLRTVDVDKAKLAFASPPSPEVTKYLSEKILVEWTYHSNAIEGNSLTLDETQAVIHGQFVVGKSFKDMREAENHKKAVEYVEKLVKENRSLTESEILKMHFYILAEIMPSEAGNYRQGNVRVGTSVPPDYEHVPGHMASLMKWYHQPSDIHPIKRIAILHARFELIHPFIDGNGRTGRLLMNAELMKLGYPPAIIREELRMDYYSGIEDAEKNDFSKMTEEIAVSVQKTIDMHLQVLNSPNKD